VKISWYVGKQSGPAFVEDAKRCSDTSGGRYRVEVVDLPADANAQREQLVRRLAARDTSIDLIGMDVIWTAEFAEAGWVKEWTGARAAEVTDGRVAAALKTAQYKGRTWAAPQNTNAQLLFYRKDLVPRPPQTWDEMIAMSKQLGDKGRIEAQGARYEGLTVWFSSLVASAGGEIVQGDKVTLGAPAVRALEVMKSLVDSGTASPALSNAQEGESTEGFIAQRSAFMVNYSALYGSIKKQAPDLVPKVGVAPWPGVVPGQPAHVTLGGFNLGVGAYTRHPDQAFAAAACLVDQASQVHNAVAAGLPPTMESLYTDPQVVQGLGFADLLLNGIRNASTRPVTPAYNDVSLVIQRTLHPPGHGDPRRTADALRQRLRDALHSGGLI